MHRRTLLRAVGAAGVAGLAGCGGIRSDRTLMDPTVTGDSEMRRAIVFSDDGEEVGHFGVDGRDHGGVVSLSTEIWHREGTTVRSITLRVWTVPSESGAATVALASPVQGDSSPPPDVSLYTPDRDRGKVVEITDLDDLADETISTIDLLVRPQSASARKIVIDAEIELTEGGVLGTDYTLDGQLALSLPSGDQ